MKLNCWDLRWTRSNFGHGGWHGVRRQQISPSSCRIFELFLRATCRDPLLYLISSEDCRLGRSRAFSAGWRSRKWTTDTHPSQQVVSLGEPQTDEVSCWPILSICLAIPSTIQFKLIGKFLLINNISKLIWIFYLINNLKKTHNFELI